MSSASQMQRITPPVRATRTLTAADFKATCLALMDEVNEKDLEIIITKRGKPVARLAPLPPVNLLPFLGRSPGILEETGDLVSPVNPEWEVDADL
jgi:prevent-host-death family protein